MHVCFFVWPTPPPRAWIDLSYRRKTQTIHFANHTFIFEKQHTNTQTIKQTIKGHEKHAVVGRFSPCGSMFATGGHDK